LTLRSATVRQASQQLSIGLLILFVLPMFAVQYLPEAWRVAVFSRLQNLNLQMLFILLAAGWLVVDLALAALAVKRFQRSALIE
jgi:hypothetical protein